MDLEKWVKKRNFNLRQRLVTFENGGIRKYLLSSFTGTEQLKDIQKNNFPTIHKEDFFRVKKNVKAWDPVSMQQKGGDITDFHDNAEIISSLGREFDIPYWALTNLVGGPLINYNDAFTFQIKGCNAYCPWCFVDESNKNGKKGNGEFFSTKGIMDIFEEERKDIPLNMIRSSGGEPTLVIENWLEILREFDQRGLTKKICLWGDTNLTTGHFIDYLEDKHMIEKFTREQIGEYANPQILCSFKGTDTESFLKANGFIKKQKGKIGLDGKEELVADERYSFLEKERWYSFRKMVEAGIDVYPFIYDPNPDTVEQFMEEGARRFGEGFYLKTWAFKLGAYGPFKTRYEKMGIDPTKEEQRLNDRFQRTEEIMTNLIWSKFGINYKFVSRSGIPLKIQN